MQSRALSLVEATANVVVGFCLAMMIQLIAFPVFGIHLGPLDNLSIALLFTAVSVARSYVLRRLFARLS